MAPAVRIVIRAVTVAMSVSVVANSTNVSAATMATALVTRAWASSARSRGPEQSYRAQASCAATTADAQPEANMATRSFGSSSFRRAPVANFGRVGIYNRGQGLQGTAYGQGTRSPAAGTARTGGANVVPAGVYNQFGFGVTTAALNSADPFNRSVHENRPNMMNADAYNSQFAHWSYGLSSYYGGFGADSSYVPRENGYSPFVYDSSLYDRRNPSNFNTSDYYVAYGSGALEYRRLTTVVAQPAVYEYSHPLTAPAAPPKPAAADQVGTAVDAAHDAFKAGDYSKALELTDQLIGQMPGDELCTAVPRSGLVREASL